MLLIQKRFNLETRKKLTEKFYVFTTNNVNKIISSKMFKIFRSNSY